MSETYRDPSRSVDERVADLLGRMTLEEKVGQVMQLDGGRGDLNELINQKQVGSLLHIQNEGAAKAMDMAAETRLGIPILFGDDCIHGHSFHSGATIFPTQLAMASSWNTELIEEAARITAKEVRLTGLKWTFSPVLCIARDLRWGRVGETFGEDPFLIGEFGCAMIRGYQGKGLDDPEAILACAKHFAAYSETQGGRDASEADTSPRKMRSFFLPPFERAAREGCLSFMTGYQSIEGVPSTANRWLLNDVLKEEWGFQGILVTDWDNVGRMHWEQKVVPTLKEAAALAIKSGNDLMMATPGFYEAGLEAIAEGLATEAELDAIVERILTLKFRMGLFEDPGKPDIARQKIVIGCDEHRAVNVEIARRSVILLQNDGLLPLRADALKRIAVIGPNADDPQAQLGDWAGNSGQVEWIPDGHPRECTKTLLDGVKALAGEGCEVTYSKGAELTFFPDTEEDDGYDDGQVKRRYLEIAEPDEAMIAEAVKSAEAADVAVVVVGDNKRLFGECRSTATLEMQGGQLELLDALSKTGTPLVVVLINSKPLVLPKSVQKSAAIIEAFSPGMMGGQAIAEAIFGALNPSGRLTVSIPYHVGQQPIYYNQVRGQHGDRYADLTQDPHFAFGFGLSYTSFAYSDLQIKQPTLSETDILEFSVTVTNTGERAGRETVQAYIADLVTSATWVNKELKTFQQVDLEPGESKAISLSLPVSACTIVNAAGQRVVEPGEFELQVGSSSRDCDLLKTSFEVK
ncbi:glycoside hydrolase family 3 N-terminal domain-containing protein [Cerasicoccus maritimus]|uniref:glycoside hydrolase family 3 N-terminal domain-containing protein n=1 Tax=Cerasicoccus maritimus TaxID=490089 RepID=UPI0028526978|nr:glycoside hydrolase family 3 N-terminal domain-containing protein [Cerasicoccus maritimus]